MQQDLASQKNIFSKRLLNSYIKCRFIQAVKVTSSRNSHFWLPVFECNSWQEFPVNAIRFRTDFWRRASLFEFEFVVLRKERFLLCFQVRHWNFNFGNLFPPLKNVYKARIWISKKEHTVVLWVLFVVKNSGCSAPGPLLLTFLLRFITSRTYILILIFFSHRHSTLYVRTA